MNASAPSIAPDRRQGLAVGALGGVGALVLTAGVLLPWLTFHAGLQRLNGLVGHAGWLLLAGAGLALVLSLAFAWRAVEWRRTALGAIGFVLLAACAYLIVQLIATHNQLRSDPFLVVSLGPGLFVAAAGAILIFGTVFVRAGVPSLRFVSVRSAIVAALLVAGTIHLALVPGHLASAPLIGAGFLAAGLIQFALAASVAMHGGRRVLAAVAASSMLFTMLYVTDVVIGLPFHHGDAAAAVGEPSAGADHPHGAEHAHGVDDAHGTSHGEGAGHHAGGAHHPDGRHDEGSPQRTVDPIAGGAKAAELVAMVGSVGLILRSRRQRTGSANKYA